MKGLYKKLLLFIGPILVALILLPTKTDLRYKGLVDDCSNHASWIYNRLYVNPAPIDIALFGSSHTITGLDDELIDSSLANFKVANLGYCRLGRNLTDVLIKETFKQKPFKYAVIEVREDENRYSHPVFPHLASTKQVLLANPIFNRDFLSDLTQHFNYKIALAQDYLFQKPNIGDEIGSTYGFSSSRDTADSEYLAGHKKGRSVSKGELTELERNFHMSYSRGYFKRIYKFCANNDIKLFFVYLPSYGTYVKVPKEFKIYSDYGILLETPQAILSNPNYWVDDVHLNNSGAQKISTWLAEELKTRLD